MKPTKTAALYARFSSDMQKDRSIEDQFALCRVYAEREGFKVVGEFADRAKSGASLFDRDDLLQLMTDAKARKFDAVIVESLDRMSRDQEDLAGLFKKLKFYGIEIRTLNEGVATDIHIGLRGMFGAMFLKDLAAKVRRGHLGRVREGLVPGIVAYGYDRVLGKPGERVINHEEAAVVRRIFAEYANGTSPRAIALGLTRDKVPSPNGAKAWSHQSFTSGGGKTGILGNRLYIGELVWNRHHNVQNPETGIISARANPETEHTTVSIPHLRIVDQALWDAAQAVRQRRTVSKFGKVQAVIPRNEHLLSGLLRCGHCSGHMILSYTSRGNQYVTCSAAHVRSACPHRKSYVIDKLASLVIDRMRQDLTDPEFIKEEAKSCALEYARVQKENSSARLTAEKRRNRLTIEIERLVDAITDTDQPVTELMAKIKAKEIERVGLEERIRLLGAETNVTTLHPNTLTAFSRTVETLHASLAKGATDKPEIRAAFRNVIDSIVVHPTEYRKPYEVSVYGRLAAIMGVDLFPTVRSNAEILAEQGVNSALEASTSQGQVQGYHSREKRVILLGRWRAAA